MATRLGRLTPKENHKRLPRATGAFLLKRLLFIGFLIALFFAPFVSRADELGEFILNAIQQGQKPTDASLLLMTRDLNWYKQNMEKLPKDIAERVQKVRVQLAGNAASGAALELGEADSMFGATGSWKAGSDMDIIYFGKNGDAAAAKVGEVYERASGNMIAALSPNDPILRAYRTANPATVVPSKLTAQSMAIVTTELPDFGYDELRKVYAEAQEALKRGASPEEVMQAFNNRVKDAMAKNMKAHFEAARDPDYYRGATGQEWFKKNYLEDPKKMRTFTIDPTTGQIAVKEAGLAAVPEEIARRAGFGGFTGINLRFPKQASDFSMFFSHSHGAGDNAKYVVRIYNDLDMRGLKLLTAEEANIIALAHSIVDHPTQASILLNLAGVTQEEFTEKAGRILYKWTEDQLTREAQLLIKELEGIGKTADDIEKLFAQARLKFDLNELVSGLDTLKKIPNNMQQQMIKALQEKFGGSEAGEKVIRYITSRLGLMSDTGDLARRILKVLQELGQITDDEAKAALKNLDEGLELPEVVAGKVKRARKEIMVLSAGAAVEFDDTIDMEKLMEDWRRTQPNAQIQSPSPELKQLIKDINDPPPSTPGRTGLGLTPEEMRMQAAIRDNLKREPGTMQRLGQKLSDRLGKVGLTLREFQQKLRLFLFNPAYTQFGDPSASVGALDMFVGVAAGLYQTYDILFNRSLSPEDENLELGNAWVTAIPVVGDFAQGFITGGQAWYEGDKGKGP